VSLPKNDSEMERLELEKKIVEAKLDLEKLKKTFDSTWSIVPKLTERIEENDLSLDVITLGLTDIKNEISSLSSRIKQLEKSSEKRSKDYEERLQKIKMDITSLLTSLEESKLTQQNLMEDVENKMKSEIATLREIINRATSQVDLMQKNFDSLAGNVRALQKTVEMTDNSALLSQIDALNLKIVNLSVALEQLKTTIPDNSGLSRDVGVITNRIQNLQTNIMAIKDEMSEKEKRIILNEVELEKMKNSYSKSIEELEKKLKNFEENFVKASNIDLLANFSAEAKRKVNQIENAKTEIEKMQKSVEAMFYDFNKRILDISSLRPDLERLKKLVFDIIKRMEKPDKKEGAEKYIEKLNKRLEEAKGITKLPDKTVLDILERLKILEERISLLEMKEKSNDEVPIILE